MHKLILCDDHGHHNKTLRLMLERVIDTYGIQAQVALATTRVKEVVSFCREDQGTSVYFLDICLEEAEGNTLDGIALGKVINALAPRAYIVYISAYSQYALDCCHNHAFDFLIKPFSEQQLAACLTAIVRDSATRRQGLPLAVTAGSRTVMLDQDKIVYFKKSKEYISAYTVQSQQSISWRESFTELAARLQAGMFVQCHKSYYANVHLLKEARWNESSLVMIDNTVLPVSRRREKAVRKAIGTGVPL